MEICRDLSFRRNQQTVYPALDGDRSRYALKGCDWNLFKRENLRPVTSYARDIVNGVIDPELFDDPYIWL